MKKLLLTAVLLSACFILFAQGSKEGVNIDEFLSDKPAEVRVVALKGPTGMGLAPLMEKAEKGSVGGNSYTFELVGNVAEVAPKLVKGEADIAAIPANLASVIYNNTKVKVKVLAVNTLGVLYLVGNGGGIDSIEQLRGKRIYASGKKATPEYVLNYLLSQAGLVDGRDIFIEWKSEHAECVAAVLNDKNAFAMLPQPFVTTALMSNKDLGVILDLNEAWNSLIKDSSLLTGVVVARSEFVNENKKAVENFLKSYFESTEFVNGNVAESAAIIGRYSIVPEKVAAKALPECNIVCITGDEMKEKLSGYLEVLFSQDAKAVGNALPEDDFYFIP